MAESSNVQRTGNIYDLGYRNYDGPRLGRGQAGRALFTYSLLSIWGIGRSWLAKLFPFGLAIIAGLPALVFLGIAALLPEEFELTEAYEYFGFVSTILALFCAVSAPELIGRDQRHHTLALYFSRALSRIDYASAKLGALALSLFTILVVPQIVVQIGNAVATDDTFAYLEENLDLIPPIVASSLLVAAVMGSVSMAISIQTPRRAFATGAVIGVFVILTALGGVFLETLTGDMQQYSLLISPLLVLDGAVLWIFGAEPPLGGDVERAGLDGVYYFLAALVYSGASLALVYRRILRMGV